MFAIRIRRAAAATSLLAVAASLAACSDSAKTAPATIAGILAEGGAQQNVIVGASVTDSLKVQVTTSNATLASGVEVDWTIIAGDGTVSATTSRTNANGEAAISYKAGTKAQLAQISAKVSGLDAVLFNIQQSADAAQAENVGANEPTVAMIGAGSVPISVVVVDEFGNPVSGQTVFWAVTNGGAGTFDLPSSVTDSNGNATVNFTPGTSPGTVTIEATTGSGIKADISLPVVSPN